MLRVLAVAAVGLLAVITAAQVWFVAGAVRDRADAARLDDLRAEFRRLQAEYDRVGEAGRRALGPGDPHPQVGTLRRIGAVEVEYDRTAARHPEWHLGRPAFRP